MLAVTDQGIGMSPDQLAEAEHTILHPPTVGLTVVRSLGFTVIGRLAQRHGLAVRLAALPGGGITASVHLPAAIVDPEADAGRAAPVADAVPEPAATADVPDLSLIHISEPTRPY